MIFILYDSYGDGQAGTYKATFNNRVLLECSSDCGWGLDRWYEKRSEQECFAPTTSPTTFPSISPSSSFLPTETVSFELMIICL